MCPIPIIWRREMEKPGTNPVLGFRTAGSGAEFEVGEMLAREMRDIGLSDVVKDRVEVDAWDFHHAVLSFRDRQGRERSFQLGAYQTQFDTQGPKTYSLVYAGKGTARDYEGLDVRDKLVLVDINQRDEWWINFPVYQAKLKGAAALIAVQDQATARWTMKPSTPRILRVRPMRRHFLSPGRMQGY